MPLSKYTRSQNIMDVINGLNTGTAQYPTTWIALSTTAPNADGTGVTEPSGNGYSRIPTRYNIMSGMQQYVSNFPNSATYDSGTDKYSISNTKDIYFYEATGSWGTITHFAIFSSSSGGNMIAYGALNSPISPAADTIPVIRAGQLTIVEQ